MGDFNHLLSERNKLAGFDRDVLFNSHDFSAAHWQPLQRNSIESTSAIVRVGTNRTKGWGSHMTTLTMVWQLARAGAKDGRRLKGSGPIPRVLEGTGEPWMLLATLTGFEPVLLP